MRILVAVNVKNKTAGATMKGYEIHFEGPDGSGKGTQIHPAADVLAKMYGRSRIVVTEEPWKGDGTYEVIRRTLDKRWPDMTVSPDMLQWAFTLNRRFHRHNKVLPAILDNKIVLQDRSWVSTITYLAATSDRTYEEARDWVFDTHQRELGDLIQMMPDLILVIMVSPDVALDRMKSRDRKLESFDKDLEVQRRVYEAYQQFVDDSTLDVKRIAIDGEQEIAAVHRDVLRALSDILGLEAE